MKKFSFLTLAVASLLLASCSNDEDLQGTVPDGTPVDVTFTADIANLGTRAYGDGLTARHLDYAVYDKDGDFLFKDEATFPDGQYQTNVTIQLVTGEAYKIVFWAQDKNNTAYKFDAAAKTMTIDYTNIANNNESLDAFYTLETLTVNASQLNKEATLTRPFAQINIATGDKKLITGKDDEGHDIAKPIGQYPTTSKVILNKVPNTLNLLTGGVSGDAEVTLKSAAIPEGKIKVGGVDYDYLSMSYVLAPVDGAVVNSVQMNVDSYPDDDFTYTSIPVKRNYKTNIVGDLLTEKTVWTVKIDPSWNIPTISNNAELREALEQGGDYVLTGDLKFNTNMVAKNNITLDLNGYTLDVDTKLFQTLTNTVEIYNGTIKSTENVQADNLANKGKMHFKVGDITEPDKEGKLILSNVTFNMPAVSGIEPYGYATIILNNVKMNCGAYCVGTEATNVDKQTTNIIINGGEFKGMTPIFINTPANLVMTDANVYGTMHGVVVRGGSADITGGKIYMTYPETESESDADNMANYFNTRNWSSGNTINLGALVIGNKVAASSNSYRYPSVVNLKGVNVACQGIYGPKFPTVYLWANPADGQGITFTYDAATTFTGNGKGLIVGSTDNLTINGVTPTSTGVYE